MTLPELLVVLVIAGLAVGVAGLYLRPAELPLATGVELTEGFLRQARMKAIANTSAFRVIAPTTGSLRTESASSCDAVTWTPDDGDLALPAEVDLSSTSWSVCFNARGVSTSNVTLTLTHPDFGSAQVEVLLGGTTQVL